ncbi:MAG: hypothetical protein NZM11_12225, partial [Anaerolineales bacterium]|nr:hypothetical protein [Anaerolineales bacterium]
GGGTLPDNLCVHTVWRPSFAPGFFGPPVTLIRTLTDGTETREALPTALAVSEALHGAQNGLTVARVKFGLVKDTYGYSA